MSHGILEESGALGALSPLGVVMAAVVVGVNKFGFPLVSCYRCGGSGNYGPVQVEAGKCFGCGGSGKVVRAGKARKAWVEFVAAWRKSGRVLVGQITGPGVYWTGERKGSGQKVEAAGPPVVSDVACQWSVAPDGTKTATAWRCELPLADGSVKKYSTNNILVPDAPVRPKATDYWPV